MAQVDIILPLYNKAATIDRAISSVLKQTCPDWRLIIVNDGSTDGSADLVRCYRDERIVLLEQENAGPGAARNAGLQYADAEFVAFLDADDEFYPDRIANGLVALKDSGIALVGEMYVEWVKQEDMTAYWARRGVVPGLYALHPNMPVELAESYCFFFHVGSSMVRRHAALAYRGFYDQDRCVSGEDTVFFARIMLNEPFLVAATLAVCHHREDSALSHNYEHGVAPFLQDPGVLLNYCPAEKKDWLHRILARMALRSAHHFARNGHGKTARDLLGRFPQARQWPMRYYKCQCEVALSRWLPYWVRFKCFVGPRVRLWAKKLMWALGLAKPTPRIKQ